LIGQARAWVKVTRTIMGIYDRDYYRRDSQSFLGSLTDRGTVCWWLIGINAACFILQMLTRNPQTGRSTFTDFFQLDVHEVWHGEVWRLLTYAFLHTPETLWHILINMLLLYFFGRDVEEAYGPREFLCFYLVAAVLGGLAFLLLPTGSRLCIGASGAVMGVLVLAAFRDPSKTVLLFFVLPVPIWAMVAFLVIKDAFTFLGHAATGTAVQVHLAGAAFGFLYQHFDWRVTGWWPSLKGRWRRIRRPKLRLYQEERMEDRQHVPVSALTPSLPASLSSLDDEQLEAKMDAILEKISRVGKDNLTDTEREVLLRASERIRRRRG